MSSMSLKPKPGCRNPCTLYWLVLCDVHHLTMGRTHFGCLDRRCEVTWRFWKEFEDIPRSVVDVLEEFIGKEAGWWWYVVSRSGLYFTFWICKVRWLKYWWGMFATARRSVNVSTSCGHLHWKWLLCNRNFIEKRELWFKYCSHIFTGNLMLWDTEVELLAKLYITSLLPKRGSDQECWDCLKVMHLYCKWI